MAKIVRKLQKLFGSTAGPTQIGVFGSFASGSPAYTTDPVTIQSLSEYAAGWFAAVEGDNSPAIEDWNALFFLAFYQLSYLFQEGVAEWDATTTYYIGSIVNDGLGNLYASTQDNNINHVVSNVSFWKLASGSAGGSNVTIDPATQSPYTISAGDTGKTFLVNSVNGAMTFNLPTPAAGFSIRIKDKTGSGDTNNITMHRFGSELFANLAADYAMVAAYQEILIDCDGTNYFIVGR